MPYFPLAPWTTAHQLSSTLSRLEEAYGDRPCFVGLAEKEWDVATRPVHAQLDDLRNPADGYRAWYEFVSRFPNFVPQVQLEDPGQLDVQVGRLRSLNRGLLIVVGQPLFDRITALEVLVNRISQLTDGGNDALFLLDLGKVNNDILNWEFRTVPYAATIMQQAPNSFALISASSFPEGFTGISEQEIFERKFFIVARKYFGGRLIYSDRGSARAERQSGGGGAPAPRIDFATKDKWTFFRSDDEGDRAKSYFSMARRAMASVDWDPKLNIWGTQMIQRTALEDHSAIISPKRSTAARINIHLHRQLFYDDSAGQYNTDDPWTD